MRSVAWPSQLQHIAMNDELIKEAGKAGAIRTSSESHLFNANSNILYLVVTGRLDAVLDVGHGSVLIIYTLPLCSPLIPCGHMAR